MEKNHKNEVINYLEKASQHTFVKPKRTYNVYLKQYECDQNDLSYFNIFQNGNQFSYLENGRIHQIDIDHYASIWKGNAKNVLSNSLFQMKKMKSVKQNKFVKQEIREILNNIK